MTTRKVTLNTTPHHKHGFQKTALRATDDAGIIQTDHQLGVYDEFTVEDNTLTIEGDMIIEQF